MTDDLNADDLQTPAEAETIKSSANPDKKTKKKKKRAYSKGVETVYRNAYKAQLDLISLAATKANIMISLNGFIVSILLVSGSVLFTKAPEFIVPLIIFLITSVSSIYFALSSATPETPAKRRKLLPCLGDLLTRKISFKEFNDFRNTPEKVFDRKNSNILIFEDYAKISKEVYLECMDELIHDPDKLYEKMSGQLYLLGRMADRKFTYLRYSYSIFRWGLILSITVFLGMKSIHYLFPHGSVAATNILTSSDYMSFDKIFEPSGAQSLPDGRIVIIEDEASAALQVVEIQADKTFKKDFRLSGKLMQSFPRLNDLEAITLGPDGYIYAMTSHQRNSGGERVKDRELFIRFKIEGDKVIDAGIYKNLVKDIDESGILGKVDEQGNGGINNINIESMSFDHEKRLMIGFRSPLIRDKSIIGIIENPSDVFEHKARPLILQKPVLLNLHGGGIRAMTYDEILGGYLISNEIYGLELDNGRYSQMLFWDGNSAHRVHHMKNPGIKNVEGITTVMIDGETRVLVVSDDGKKLKNRSASYILLKYGELKN